VNRGIVFSGALPLDTDILQPQRYAMEGIGYLLQMLAGTGTSVVGLGCTPTATPSLTVNVGPGAIATMETVDSTAYGSLPANTDQLMKMGINLTTTPFTISPPSTSGQSQVFLIQAAFSEADTNPVVLPYYNASNPAQPFNGPNNSGTSQNTRRMQTVVLSLVAGVAATTGTQVVPAPTSGNVALWDITVANGATTITSSNIVADANAPFYQGPFAAQNGSSRQPFNVANANQSSEAVSLGQFTFNKASNGSEELPDGNIRQWGAGSINATGAGISTGTFTLPETFPNGMLFSIAQFSGSSPPPSGSVTSVQAGSNNSVTLYINTASAGTYAVCYEVVGW